MHNDPEYVNISTHWKVFSNSGETIDEIENQLRYLSGRGVYRTETLTDDGFYNANFVVTGKIRVSDLVKMCDYMDEVHAFPI